jgi:nitrite reductase/ring-hydroxylating ferredoxin subunit
MALVGILDRVERLRALDRIGDPVLKGVRAVFHGRLADALQGVWLGHPLHPAIIQAPLGAWTSAAILDAVPGGTPAATLLIGVGNATAVPAAITGINDWSTLTPQQRRVGLVHLASNAVAVGLYAGSLAARLTGNKALGKRLAYAGMGVISVSAFVGGHLAHRQAASVNEATPLLHRVPEGWQDVCGYSALTEGKPLVAHVGETPVLVTRTGEEVHIMIEHCGHNTGPLGDGEFTQVDGVDCVVCPWHGSAFRLDDGRVVHGPAVTDQPMLRTRVVDGRVQAALP